MPTAHTVRLYRAQLSSTDESERCGRAPFAVRHLSEMRLLITAAGDLDATNARALGRFVERHTGVSKQLGLDLSDVEFFDSEGFAALHYVSVHCAATTWTGCSSAPGPCGASWQSAIPTPSFRVPTAWPPRWPASIT
jgi:ABC-type transporter Mla MlaB component